MVLALYTDASAFDALMPKPKHFVEVQRARVVRANLQLNAGESILPGLGNACLQ